MKLRALVILALALPMAACGGNSAPGDERGELAQAVRDYSAAYLGGQAEAAHQLLSRRCRDRISIDEMTVAATGAKVAYGSARLVAVDVVDLSGALARVTYRYDVAAIDQEAEPWAKEGGRWRQDDC